MRARTLLTIIIVATSAAAACSSAGDDDASAPLDGAPDGKKVGVKDDGVASDVTAADVAPDVLDAQTFDAPPDVAQDQGAPDVAADVLDAGAELEGGNLCPGIGLCSGACSCDAGYKNQWHVWDPADAGTIFLCGLSGAPSNPDCPSGWKCQGYKNNVLTTATCP